MNKNIDNAIRIPTSLDGDFFKYWLEFLSPFHNLTKKEIEITAALIKERYELSKVIKDDAILNRVIMSEDVRKKIEKQCGISYFHIIVGRLKKKNIIINGRINPKFLPNIKEDKKSCALLLVFDL